MVASPRPKAIVERDVIQRLLTDGVVVIACGGGGIAVIENEQGDLVGIESVIDKDYSSALLASSLSADLFVISTAVEKVALRYRTPQQQWLDRIPLGAPITYNAPKARGRRNKHTGRGVGQYRIS